MWALNAITGVLITGRCDTHKEEKVDVKMQAEIGAMLVRNAGRHKKLEEARNVFSSRASRRNMALLTP